jgi:hypothetical protein
MTLRIEKTPDGPRTIVRLIGRINSEHLQQLKAEMRDSTLRIALDLKEVTLVDLDTVHFLCTCQAQGIEVLNCSPYIKEWMTREKARTG